jgi:glycosyltransferase involved in cell wall biosynthesis
MINSLSVCICTHNRSGMLSMVLDKFETLIVPEGLLFDVLIVDNGSTDDTAKISSRYIKRNPGRFRYIYEGNLGLSNARNRGFRETDSEVVAFIDDDAVPRDGWLEALIEGYGQGEDVGVVGGQALLVLPDTPLPIWFKKPLYSCFSEREIKGEKIFQCNKIVDYPFGANISFRRELAIEAGQFNTNLGRVGKKLLSGEETLLCRRIHKRGYRILIHPKAIADHYIQPDRISLKYLLKQAWADGQVCYVWREEAYTALSLFEMLFKLFEYTIKYTMRIFIYSRTLTDFVIQCYSFLVDISMIYHRWKFGRAL